ncbi:MAG: cation transporter [Streptosporangiales bacterium]|nr:cation transporter [Streptosporangiales bacterium]
MRWVIGLAAPLVAFWLLLSGHYTVLLLTLGVVSIVLTVWVVSRMERAEVHIPVRMALRLPLYCLWLGGQILLSALKVLGQVWSPRLAPKPRVDVTPVDGIPELSQAIYANSITLTPGTLSLEVDDRGIEVHALRSTDLDDLQAGSMLRRVKPLEGR